jgi:hypothetical protein
MPPAALTSAVDGLVPGAFGNIVDVHVGQDNRIAILVKRLTAIDEQAVVLQFGHCVTPSGTRSRVIGRSCFRGADVHGGRFADSCFFHVGIFYFLDYGGMIGIEEFLCIIRDRVVAAIDAIQNLSNRLALGAGVVDLLDDHFIISSILLAGTGTGRGTADGWVGRHGLREIRDPVLRRNFHGLLTKLGSLVALKGHLGFLLARLLRRSIRSTTEALSWVFLGFFLGVLFLGLLKGQFLLPWGDCGRILWVIGDGGVGLLLDLGGSAFGGVYRGGSGLRQCQCARGYLKRPGETPQIDDNASLSIGLVGDLSGHVGGFQLKLNPLIR